MKNYHKVRAISAIFIVLISFIFSSYTLWSLSTNQEKLENFYVPTLIELNRISLLHTQKHLWLEEFLSGDERLNQTDILQGYDIIDTKLANVEKILDKLKEDHNIDTSKYFNTIIEQHKNVSDIMRYRIQSGNKAAAGSEYDETFDQTFNRLINSIQSFSENINKNIQQTLGKITTYKRYIYTLLLIFILTTLYLILMYIQSQKDHQATLKKEVNNKTKELQIALIKAQDSTKAKSEFLANMSHEIRTPLNAIVGFTDLLSSKINDQELSIFVEQIKNGSKTLLTIINDILDLSKIDAGKMTIQYSKTNIKTMLHELESLFILKAQEQGLTFSLKLGESFPTTLLIDETRVRQILINLLSNAMKFTSVGSITIGAECLKHDKKSCTIRLYVQDTGLGITTEDQERLFEDFTQKEGQDNRRYGGTGLGLSICKKLSKLMNGKLTLESELNKGSIFSLYLYDIILTQENLKEETDVVKMVDLKGKVLLVEDIEPNRLLVNMMLEEGDIEVVEAIHGKEALEKLQNFIPDIILMDIQMPVMDGFETTKHIRNDERLKHLPIIALTASVMKEEIDEILKHDFNDHLGKPIDQQKFVQTIAKYLKRV